MIQSMPSIRGLDPFPPDPWGGAPDYVRQAARAKARSFRAVRLYRRRGWNDSAVAYALERDTAALANAIARWQHLEDNPPLF